MAYAGKDAQVLYVRVSTIPLLIYTLLPIVTVHIYYDILRWPYVKLLSK